MKLEWVVADAQALPFGDGEFDAVTSCFGAMFAPDHRAVADELLRVCKPGGAIAMANFTPEGGVGEFFGVFAPYLPAPPPGALPPVLWGDETHVRELFGDRASLELERRWLVERCGGGPRAYCDFYRETFGPAVAAYAGAGDHVGILDRAFLDFATRMNRGAAQDPPSTTTSTCSSSRRRASIRPWTEWRSARTAARRSPAQRDTIASSPSCRRWR